MNLRGPFFAVIAGTRSPKRSFCTPCTPSERTLDTMNDPDALVAMAVGELRCTRPRQPSTLAELRGLVVARRAVEDLTDASIAELRSSATPSSWSEIAGVLGLPSAQAGRQRHRRRSSDGSGG